jgi:hypothetical protein
MQNSFYEILGDQAAVNHFPFTVATRVSIPLREANFVVPDLAPAPMVYFNSRTTICRLSPTQWQ